MKLVREPGHEAPQRATRRFLLPKLTGSKPESVPVDHDSPQILVAAPATRRLIASVDHGVKIAVNPRDLVREAGPV